MMQTESIGIRRQAVRTLVALGAALAAAACGTSDKPSINMTAEVNALTLSTADTLVVTRALTNFGGNDVWLNASAPAFEMRDAAGQPACATSEVLAISALELARIEPDSTLLDTREYALADRANCAPGAYTISLVATFRTSEDAPDSFSIRTPPAPFTLTAPPAALRARP